MNNKIDLSAMTVDNLAEFLSKSGSSMVSRELIEIHIQQQGAPVNKDGTINLINYTAWLVKEYQHGKPQ